MVHTTPYFTFNGNAKKAINFYAEVFNAEIEAIQTFGDADFATPPGMEERIMHGKIRKGDFVLMFSDSFSNQEIKEGNRISLTLDLASEEEISTLYEKIRDEGFIHMELQDTFWGARFAKVRDRFGVTWDLSYTKNEDE